MHWFDRFSEHVATTADAPTTRRTLVKGATLATLALPLAPDALAYSKNRTNAYLANQGCLTCFSNVTRDYSKAFDSCKGGGGSPAQRLAKPKGPRKPKRPKKAPAKPAEAARDASCLAGVAGAFLIELNNCKKYACSNPAPPPGVEAENGNPGSEASACAPGTTKCTDSLCCYGGDACCPCGKDMICCAGVIGCTCC